MYLYTTLDKFMIFWPLQFLLLLFLQQAISAMLHSSCQGHPPKAPLGPLGFSVGSYLIKLRK
jgi:hypothetical protein